MQFIPVNKGHYALVDDGDSALAACFSWSLHTDGYAKTNAIIKGKSATLYLHNLIHPSPQPLITDHRNGKILDCRRSNLRSIPRKANIYNRRVQQNSGTQIKGVTWAKDRQRFRAYITYEGQCITFGSFATAEEAMYVREQAELQLFGEYARLTLLC